MTLAQPSIDEQFATCAREFCEWVRSEPGDEHWETKRAVGLCSQLYALGVQLSMQEDCDLDLEGERISFDERHKLYRRFRCLPVGYYGVVLDPLEIPPPDKNAAGIGDIGDDIIDIYMDMDEGLSLWDKGHRNEAVYHWQTSWLGSWGEDAADVVRILHSHIRAKWLCLQHWKI